MRRSITVLLALLVFPFLLGLPACFSSNRPDRNVPTQPGDDSLDRAVVRGLVWRLRGEGDWVKEKGWAVSVVWLGPDSDLDGHLDPLHESTVASNADGVYSASTDEKRVRAAQVRSGGCEIDYPPCCFNLFSVCPQCPDGWIHEAWVPVSLGEQVQRDIRVGCR